MSTTQHDAPELPVPGGVWRVDQDNSAVGFAVKDMWGLRTVQGAFRTFDGTLSVVGARAEGHLTIEAESLETGHTKRDEHLRSSDFFDVERHPRLVFTTTTVVARDGELIVSGTLNVGSSQVALQIPLKVEHRPDGAVTLRGEVRVSREAAGLRWNKLGMIRGDAKLHVRLTLRAASSQSPPGDEARHA